MNVRPEFNPSGLPASVIARVTEKAAASWCYAAPDGGTFYVSETKARAMLAAHGGEIFPPKEA